MKNIPLNYWRLNLTDDDWQFFRCPIGEEQACLRWELLREIKQAEHGGTFPSSFRYFPTNDELRFARYSPSIISDEDMPQMLKEFGRTPQGKFEKPRWLPYLKVPQEDSDRFEKTQQFTWEWLDTDWRRFFYQNWDALHEIVRTIPSKSLWLGGDGHAEICPLLINWGFRDEDLECFFREWLKEFRPKGEPWDDRPRVDEPPKSPKSKGGAGTPVRQAKANLKRLAAWRLIQRYNGNYIRAYAHPNAAKYLGRQYGVAGAWSRARAKVHRMMADQYIRPAD